MQSWMALGKGLILDLILLKLPNRKPPFVLQFQKCFYVDVIIEKKAFIPLITDAYQNTLQLCARTAKVSGSWCGSSFEGTLSRSKMTFVTICPPPFPLPFLGVFLTQNLYCFSQDFRKGWDRQSRAFHNLFRQADRVEKLAQIIERLVIIFLSPVILMFCGSYCGFNFSACMTFDTF